MSTPYNFSKIKKSLQFFFGGLCMANLGLCMEPIQEELNDKSVIFLTPQFDLKIRKDGQDYKLSAIPDRFENYFPTSPQPPLNGDYESFLMDFAVWVEKGFSFKKYGYYVGNDLVEVTIPYNSSLILKHRHKIEYKVAQCDLETHETSLNSRIYFEYYDSCHLKKQKNLPSLPLPNYRHQKISEKLNLFTNSIEYDKEESGIYWAIEKEIKYQINELIHPEPSPDNKTRKYTSYEKTRQGSKIDAKSLIITGEYEGQEVLQHQIETGIYIINGKIQEESPYLYSENNACYLTRRWHLRTRFCGDNALKVSFLFVEKTGHQLNFSRNVPFVNCNFFETGLYIPKASRPGDSTSVWQKITSCEKEEKGKTITLASPRFIRDVIYENEADLQTDEDKEYTSFITQFRGQ